MGHWDLALAITATGPEKNATISIRGRELLRAQAWHGSMARHASKSDGAFVHPRVGPTDFTTGVWSERGHRPVTLQGVPPCDERDQWYGLGFGAMPTVTHKPDAGGQGERRKQPINGSPYNYSRQSPHRTTTFPSCSLGCPARQALISLDTPDAAGRGGYISQDSRLKSLRPPPLFACKLRPTHAEPRPDLPTQSPHPPLPRRSMAYTSSLHLPKHLLLPNPRRTSRRPSSVSFVPAAAANTSGGVNGHAPEKPTPKPNGKKGVNGINGVNGKKAANGINGKKKGVNGHVNGHADRIHLSVSTGGGQDGSGLRVAFQGAPGAYSEFAAKTALPGCDTVPCRAFADALAAVERGGADRAILPVESTMEGTALRNYDLLLRHDLVVVQEINLFVHYCLLAMPGVRAAEVRRVISHPMALAHCGRALARLGVDREPVEDTAGAVEMLRSNRMLDTAAIASPRAADLYGLDVLAHGLQDESWNVTRFLLLSRPPSPVALPVDSDAKTSMVVAHRGGSMMVLLKVLSAFSSRNINLTKLEVINNEDGASAAAAAGAGGHPPVMILDTKARGAPTLRAFPHVLYVDCEGASHDPRVREAIQEIEKFAVFVRVLGCYAADSTVYDLQ
ncbi:hypothetical protein HU200_035196 [Digitaria exilis]|uniref:Prephenate dehydratase domain-containing protein n=1 Tax=Digitaria exilis TaxID=1010633 RepID=A0A835EJ76_9POAL|nr:hypothetical protein HU200_035196 [Digitaria exilis]